MANKSFRETLLWAEQLFRNENISNAVGEARILMASVSGLRISDLLFRYSDAVPEDVLGAFEVGVRRRLSGEPIQYIIGEWDFLDFTFSVREGVLIPRPETEFLVEKAVSLVPQNGTVYDLCAGTGCIGLSIAMYREDIHVILADKYNEPLSCIRENIEIHGIQNAEVLCLDITEPVPVQLTKRQPDVIVSNPPYIRTDVLPSLQKEVQREPMTALDGGEDGYLFYHALSEIWYPHLKPGGVFLMECGEGQPETVAAMFRGKSEIDRDLFDVPRFVTVYKP